MVKVAEMMDQLKGTIGEDTISKARHHVDPDLMQEKELGDKLVALRKITGKNNGELAALIFKENKRTFESWIAGRYVPEGDKLHKVNTILMAAGVSYIREIVQKRKPTNAYTGFPALFKLLDFSDAIAVLVSELNSQGRHIDYDSGAIS